MSMTLRTHIHTSRLRTFLQILNSGATAHIRFGMPLISECRTQRSVYYMQTAMQHIRFKLSIIPRLLAVRVRTTLL